MTIPFPMQCLVCGASMAQMRPWLWKCPGCEFWRSSLVGGAGDDIAGIEALRKSNFSVMLDRIGQLVPVKESHLLEVGCGRGWFMDEAAARGYRCTALEPAQAVAAEVIARGHAVHVGFFPQALPQVSTYSMIVFNDVFEHLPDPAGTVKVCHEHLSPHGLLVINLPSSRGLFFRLGRVMARAGFEGPFERLWQKGLPSPHLSYFAPSNLKTLVASRGFVEIDQFPLATLRVSGLWPRLRSTQGIGLSALMFPVLVAVCMLSRIVPSDIHVGVFQKTR